MINVIIILLGIEIGMRVLPMIDGLIELYNHFLAVQVQKLDNQIQDLAMDNQKKYGHAMPQIGFDLTPDSEEDDDFND